MNYEDKINMNCVCNRKKDRKKRYALCSHVREKPNEQITTWKAMQDIYIYANE